MFCARNRLMGIGTKAIDRQKTLLFPRRDHRAKR
jgi:hypothetical protein